MDEQTNTKPAATAAKPMSPRQYARSGGSKCPFCRGRNVKVSGAIMPDDRDHATLEVECSDCGRTWKEQVKE